MQSNSIVLRIPMKVLLHMNGMNGITNESNNVPLRVLKILVINLNKPAKADYQCPFPSYFELIPCSNYREYFSEFQIVSIYMVLKLENATNHMAYKRIFSGRHESVSTLSSSRTSHFRCLLSYVYGCQHNDSTYLPLGIIRWLNFFRTVRFNKYVQRTAVLQRKISFVLTRSAFVFELKPSEWPRVTKHSFTFSDVIMRFVTSARINLIEIQI